jgi:Ca-activated chloride channel family protein
VITFDAPVVVALAPLIGGAVWAAAVWARRARLRRAAAWSEATARIARDAGRFGAPSLGLAAALAAVALSGPRWGEERIVTETRGLNLVLSVDISRSMLAEDAKPSRLGRALREARRLVQDLDGDRLGLAAFAGTSYILSPLSVDGSALTLYLDALDPDVASEGGTSLAPALAQGIELLHASPEIADRVLVIFTDGEAHDSLERSLEEARRLAGLGIHLILVAEGGRQPAKIPVRDDRGTLIAWQQDASGNPIETMRREDILGAVADAAQGTIVAAELPDQAGAVRDLVASYKRATATESRTQRGRPRAWIPLLLAAIVLTMQTFTRRTAALVGLLLCVAPVAAQAQRPRSTAEKAWDKGDPRGAAAAYLAELKAHQDDDTAWYNTGTAALAAGDPALARASLARAAASLDPDLRFRALYNLGLLALLEAKSDSTNRETHLADAERAYREALLLKPYHIRAKWNLELVNRMRSGGGASKPNPPPPPSPNSGGGGGGGGAAQQPPPGQTGNAGGMSESQADQVLRSIGQEELRTRRDRTGRTRRAAGAGVRDW